MRRAAITSTPGATETLVSSPAGPPRTETGETMTARQQTNRIRMEEVFGNFRNSEGYVVPAKWKIKLTIETQRCRIWEWQVDVSSVKNNVTLDAKEFAVR